MLIMFNCLLTFGWLGVIYCHLNNRCNNNSATRKHSGPVLVRLHYSEPVCVALINNTQIVACMQMRVEWAGRGPATSTHSYAGVSSAITKKGLFLLGSGQFNCHMNVFVLKFKQSWNLSLVTACKCKWNWD